jgi:hypothetical protein
MSTDEGILSGIIKFIFLAFIITIIYKFISRKRSDFNNSIPSFEETHTNRIVDYFDRNYSKILTFFSLILLVSFFLPWVTFSFLSISDFSLTGFNLPIKNDEFFELLSVFDGSDYDKSSMHGQGWWLKLVYIIPVIAIINITRDFIGKKRLPFISEFGLALLYVLIFYQYLYYILNYPRSEDILIPIDYGFYSTIIISVIGWLISPKKSIIFKD